MSDPHWKDMTNEEFRNIGLLWAVNNFVLWPIGVAVGVMIPSDDPTGSLEIMQLAEAEVIEEGKIDLDKESGGCHPRERFLHYVEMRISEMPTEMEQEMARRRVRRLFPGFGVSPLKTDATS